MPTPISPEELEMQAALAEQAALLTKVWTMMPPQMGVHDGRIWQTKLSINRQRVITAYYATLVMDNATGTP
jgi:hypothetical protein